MYQPGIALRSRARSRATWRQLLAGAACSLLLSCGGGGGGGGDPDPAPESGLDVRPVNLSCVAPERPGGIGTVVTVDPFPAAPAFNQPTKILQAPGDGSRWFVVEKTGRVRVFNVNSPGTVSTWLDFTNEVDTRSEGGLLGMAFHPDYPATREVFVSYTTNPGGPMVSRVSRLILDNVGTPSTVTEQVLITVDQPFTNHNGGDIAFGPDGYLYFGLGDGGSSNDPQNLAQNTTWLLGSMLRINVVGVAWPNPAYTIPVTNPFAANPRCGPAANAAACPEIYAWGLRNPWRWSFDRDTGQLWAGDVGQNAREEVNRIQLGGNYGWRCREGFATGVTSPGDGCSTGTFVDPVIDYPHTAGNFSVTGGYVYRGTAVPGLAGRYVYGDFGSGRIWALEDDGQGGFQSVELLDTPFSIGTFGQDADGELYFADYGGGRLRQLVPGAGGGVNTIPDSLSATGCVAVGDPTQPAAGLIPYTVNAPFWSDGAEKERYMAIPDGQRITLSPSRDFQFPSGTVLKKSFRLASQLIETRLLMRHPDGVWAGYTYEWNEAQTAATRVIGGKVRQVNGQDWIYPSEGECLQCHTAAAGFALGPEIPQLNGDLRYATTGRTANQLATLDHIGLFANALPGEPADLPALADPFGTAPREDRARAWLHTNCAQCHRPSGPTPSGMDLRWNTALAATGTCNVVPQSGSLGIANARLIAAGDADRSVLVARSDRRDVNGMPPVGSTLVDLDGVELLALWIDALAGCP